jgi:hypothetical protein
MGNHFGKKRILIDKQRDVVAGIAQLFVHINRVDFNTTESYFAIHEQYAWQRRVGLCGLLSRNENEWDVAYVVVVASACNQACSKQQDACCNI